MAPLPDPTLYTALQVFLCILTFTHQDITYVVHVSTCMTLHSFRALFTMVFNVMSPLFEAWSIAYSDVDWAGCPSIRRFTSGYYDFLGQNLLAWSSKRQGTISRSSVEAEYRAAVNVVVETFWLCNLLYELLYPPLSVTLVYCDNVSVVYLS